MPKLNNFLMAGGARLSLSGSRGRAAALRFGGRRPSLRTMTRSANWSTPYAG